CLRVMERCTRSINQARNARLLIARKPLVTGLAAHSELPTYRSKRLPPCFNHDHEAHPFIHDTGLRPSHRQGPPRRSVDLLPMSPVYSVTHVASLDHPSPLPSGEREQTEFAAGAANNGEET